MTKKFGGWYEPMTDADVLAALKAGGIDLEGMSADKMLALIFELARTHGLPDVAIAAAVARMG